MDDTKVRVTVTAFNVKRYLRNIALGKTECFRIIKGNFIEN